MLTEHMAQFVVIAALIGLNAFFAASEMAIVSVRKTRIRQLADERGSRAAEAVLRLAAHPSRFLATIQIGITLAGFFASALGAVSVAVVLGGYLSTLPVPIIASSAQEIAFGGVTLVIAFLTLILGELAPKNAALQHAERMSLWVARPIELLSRSAGPAVWLLTASTNVILRALGSQGRARVPTVSEEEIKSMVDTAAQEGVVEPSTRQIIHGVFDFSERQAQDIMIPRVDVEALPAGATLDEARQRVLACGHTRLPVYEGSLDNIVGVLHARDLLPTTGGSGKVVEVMRPPFLVPETKRLSELLWELQAQGSHLAVVLDEYGGTAGIVTLENVLEEIVGPIRDEHEPAEAPEIQLEDEATAVVAGRVTLWDLNAAISLDLESEEVNTIGGLVYAHLGRLPTVGDVVQLHNASLEVVETQGPRILRVRVHRKGEPAGGLRTGD